MDDDVLALVEAIGDFFERRGDADAIAKASTGPAGADRQRWAALCAMGLPVLRLAQPDGIGAGLLEATAVAEKFGAVLLPEPAAAAIVLAGVWAAHPAAAAQLDGLCNGTRITTLSAFDAVLVSASGEVSGRMHVVDDGTSDAAAVLTRDEDTGGLALAVLDLAALPASRSSVDPTRPTTVVELVGAEPVDVLRLSDEQAGRIRLDMAVLHAAELVGGMQRVLTDTVAFVGTREQFGRPIGSFQAVKHQLADVYARTEQARALVQLAAVTCAEDPAAAAGVVGSMTRWVPRSAITLCETAIHLRGAMGFCWEVTAHLHLRRALAMRAVLRDFDPTDAAERDVVEAV